MTGFRGARKETEESRTWRQIEVSRDGPREPQQDRRNDEQKQHLVDVEAAK